jgi:hypothetical protein
MIPVNVRENVLRRVAELNDLFYDESLQRLITFPLHFNRKNLPHTLKYPRNITFLQPSRMFFLDRIELAWGLNEFLHDEIHSIMLYKERISYWKKHRINSNH